MCGFSFGDPLPANSYEGENAHCVRFCLRYQAHCGPNFSSAFPPVPEEFAGTFVNAFCHRTSVEKRRACGLTVIHIVDPPAHHRRLRFRLREVRRRAVRQGERLRRPVWPGGLLQPSHRIVLEPVTVGRRDLVRDARQIVDRVPAEGRVQQRGLRGRDGLRMQYCSARPERSPVPTAHS